MGKKKRNIVKRLILFLFVFTFVFSILSMGITIFLFNTYFGRNDLKADDIALNYNDIDSGKYPRQIINFKSGANMLQGYVYGHENTKGLIIIAPGIASGADSYLAETMYFVDNGWRVFAFDGTGTRKSEGKGIRGLTQTKIDLGAALEYIEQDAEFANLPIMLYGHSMGGYAVTAILKTHKDDIAAVMCVSGFNSPIDTMYAQAKAVTGFYANIEYLYIWLYNTAIFCKDANITAVDGINATDTPVMIIYGTADDIVPYDSIGIYAYRQKITNPNVTFVACDENFRNGHDTMQLTAVAAKYTFQKREELADLHEQYGDIIPEDVFSDFYSSIDKNAMNSLDLEYMSMIQTFYEASNNNQHNKQ
jgi:pimeloyl-ACP methyl ester carboxylesterase